MSQQFWDVSKGCTCLNIFWSPPPRIWTFIVQLHALKSSSQTRFSPFYNHASRQLPAYHRPCQPTHYIYERRSFCSNIEKSGHASPPLPLPPHLLSHLYLPTWSNRTMNSGGSFWVNHIGQFFTSPVLGFVKIWPNHVCIVSPIRPPPNHPSSVRVQKRSYFYHFVPI